MFETIFSAVGVYVSTSIDYLFILMILFAQLKSSKQKWHIYAGQYLGTGLLVAVSLMAAYLVHFVPEEWMIGLLGLIPIYLGVRFLIAGEEEEDEEEVVHKIRESESNRLFWTVTLLTIASGGDNLGIYIPYFASMNWLHILVAVAVFAVGIVVLCEVSRALSNIPLVSETVEKYERVIVPLVFIPLGIYIMLENGTLQTIWNVIAG